MVRPPFAHLFHCARRYAHPDLRDLPDLLFHRLRPEPRESSRPMGCSSASSGSRTSPSSSSATTRCISSARSRTMGVFGTVFFVAVTAAVLWWLYRSLQDHKLGWHAGPAHLGRHGHFHRLGPGRLAALRQFHRHACSQRCFMFSSAAPCSSSLEPDLRFSARSRSRERTSSA